VDRPGDAPLPARARPVHLISAATASMRAGLKNRVRRAKGPQFATALRVRGFIFSISEPNFFMQIMVRDNNVDQALRALKKKLQREGVYREMKLRRHYEKPSEKRARERAAAVRRARKMERKRAERDGVK